MNSNFNQLALKYLTPKEDDRGNCFFELDDIEKLSEALIIECVNVLKNKANETLTDDPHYLITWGQLNWAADLIKEHFDIKLKVE